MLVACRLAGLSALGAYYAGARARRQCGADANAIAASPRHARNRAPLVNPKGGVLAAPPSAALTERLARISSHLASTDKRDRRGLAMA